MAEDITGSWGRGLLGWGVVPCLHAHPLRALGGSILVFTHISDNRRAPAKLAGTERWQPGEHILRGKTQSGGGRDEPPEPQRELGIPGGKAEPRSYGKEAVPISDPGNSPGS